MYVCMYIHECCMYVCMYVGIDISMYACMSVNRIVTVEQVYELECEYNYQKYNN